VTFRGVKCSEFCRRLSPGSLAIAVNIRILSRVKYKMRMYQTSDEVVLKYVGVLEEMSVMERKLTC
jgi:hypothetical protein